ncbi:hypothetical protein K7X08_032239 [Anisodus acutangulus]|uniref:Bifunctional inhibitor/plant lipid transfer protein/seed storage helical domain-containing protein n=1 Tax=Anisodus acutangulus TaxID=402998 RepID=A0A9Q1MCA6_9SOLA|nr:hypothetical protein K7X08_032239 [Anisodus acutangulus]
MSSTMTKMIVVLSMVLVILMGQINAGPSEAECREERSVGKRACWGVLLGSNPSGACCERVRVTHTECFCPSLTPKLAAVLGVNRLIRLIRGCGRTVPPHFKCGSVTTPASGIQV